jgi:prepilin-type N-terminal cleavage/methylation domain-containing protein
MSGGVRINNNKGFTLIELMVVISIATILILGTTSIIKILTLSNTKKIAQSIDSELSNNRLLTLSKGNYRYLVIHWDAFNQEYVINTVTSSSELNSGTWSTGTIERSKKLASKDIIISYLNRGSATPIMVRDTALLINNNPSTGAFVSNSIQINIISGSTERTIYLVAKTGNHYIE